MKKNNLVACFTYYFLKSLLMLFYTALGYVGAYILYFGGRQIIQGFHDLPSTPFPLGVPIIMGVIAWCVGAIALCLYLCFKISDLYVWAKRNC